MPPPERYTEVTLPTAACNCFIVIDRCNKTTVRSLDLVRKFQAMYNSQLVLFTALAALLTSIPATLAATAIVINNCGTQLYLASVKNNNGAKIGQLDPKACSWGLTNSLAESYIHTTIATKLTLLPMTVDTHWHGWSTYAVTMTQYVLL